MFEGEGGSYGIQFTVPGLVLWFCRHVFAELVEEFADHDGDAAVDPVLVCLEGLVLQVPEQLVERRHRGRHVETEELQPVHRGQVDHNGEAVCVD